MTIQFRLLAMAICAATSIAAPTITSAQGRAPEQPAPEAEQPAPSYSDAELKSFAVAVVQVQRINDAYLPKLKTASSPEEQRQVEKTATEEMVKAVEKEGMTVKKYKQIMNHAQSNPEIGDRVMKHIQSVQSVQ
jgi:hypothetical protein